MRSRTFGTGWHKALWKILRNPAIAVIAAIIVVLFSVWIVIQTQADERSTPFPILFGRR